MTNVPLLFLGAPVTIYSNMNIRSMGPISVVDMVSIELLVCLANAVKMSYQFRSCNFFESEFKVRYYISDIVFLKI